MNLISTRGNPNMVKGGPSVNPKGRGLTNRQKIAESLIADLADTWKEHGKTVLQKLATGDPGKFATIAFGLLPRDVFVSVAPAAPGNLTPEDYAQLRGVLDAIEAAGLSDVPPGELLAGIESYLRSEFAKPVEMIEHEPVIEAPSIVLPPPPYR